MNKALHIFVYLFLALAGAALWFELELNSKREFLIERNRLQENYLVRIAKTVEKADAAKIAPLELKKDNSPVEAKIVDSPETENVLEDYNAHLEQTNLETFNWDNIRSRTQLRAAFGLDPMGNLIQERALGQTAGRGTEDEILLTLLEASKGQQARLNTTRAELVTLRGKLESVVTELNNLKPIARQDKVTIEEKKEEISKLEAEKAELENQITKLKAEIEELNTERTSLQEEIATAKEETEAVKEKLEKSEDMVAKLKELVKRQVQIGNGTKANNVLNGTLPFGDKGKIIEADNNSMFAIVEFSQEALKQLKGENLDNPMPPYELGIRRPGFEGSAGEFIGRVRIRQEVKGKPYVICDILESWAQGKAAADDIIFAD